MTNKSAASFIANWFLAKKRFVIPYSIILILTGLVYIILESLYNTEIIDAIFIGLLFGGSFILLIGGKWIQSFFLLETENFRNQIANSDLKFIDVFDSLLKSIFKNRTNVFFAILYGIVIGLIPLVYDLWDDEIALKWNLAFFLFLVNFLTGLALISLFKIFKFLYLSSKHLSFGLYDVRHVTSFITTLSKRASIIAALYVAFSITSIYFSILPLDSLTIGYSLFAALVIVAAYIIPIIPINNKTKSIKKNVLNRIASEIQEEFNTIKTDIEGRKDISLDRFERLTEIRKKISVIPTIPIGLKAVWNSLYIVAITFLPIVLQVLLEKFVN